MRKLLTIFGILILAATAVAIAIRLTNRNESPEPPEPIATKKDDLIEIWSPTPNMTVSSPLTVEGQARGTWYFEASFPVRLLDADGTVLGTAVAQAQSDWMTTEYVPFTATVIFTAPKGETGTIVLQKDNPSGLPENDNELRIPIQFDSSMRTVTLYYYDPEKDKDNEGNLICSAQGLTGVERAIAHTETPIQDTIRLLLLGLLTMEEKNSGMTTEYPLEGVTLVGASLSDGTLTLEFTDPQNKTGGGSCRVGILWAQIAQTAKQFPEVKDVKFIPEELFQP